MSRKLILAIVLLASSLTVLECAFNFFRRKTYKIHKFLDSKEPIWTYTTSRRTDILCEVDVMINISATTINFTRTSYDRKGRTSAVLHGEFHERRKKHLLVHTEGGVYDLHEEMLYMSSDHSCAVFMVTRLFGGTFRSYDLRLRNSSVAKGPRKDCVRKFKRRDLRGQVIYRPMCQDILHGKEPGTMSNSTVEG
uniref:Putative lipocalin n=1 Tax=Rhipicephalus microplus TaxID=6941 RepID=A0A6G5A5F9_RHIMP